MMKKYLHLSAMNVDMQLLMIMILQLTYFYHKPSEYKSKGYNLYTEPQENLKIYLKTHYIENLYNCLKCDSKFDKFTDLEKHSINEHEQKNSFACEECD